MEDATTIDKQGRLILPSHIREALGLIEGGEVTIRLDGHRIIIEPVSNDVKRRSGSGWASRRASEQRRSPKKPTRAGSG